MSTVTREADLDQGNWAGPLVHWCFVRYIGGQDEMWHMALVVWEC